MRGGGGVTEVICMRFLYVDNSEVVIIQYERGSTFIV